MSAGCPPHERPREEGDDGDDRARCGPAQALARAVLREGLDELPVAQPDGPELDLRLLVDHRERLVGQRVGLNNTLQWHLHDLWPELTPPAARCFRSSGAP